MSIIYTIVPLRKDKDLLMGKTSSPLCNRTTVCSKLLENTCMPGLTRLRLTYCQFSARAQDITALPSAKNHSVVTSVALPHTRLPLAQPGASWRALYQAIDTKERFITGFHVLCRIWRVMSLLLDPSGSEGDECLMLRSSDATGAAKYFPALCVCF